MSAFGETKLAWRLNPDEEELIASSVFHDDGSPLEYHVYESAGDTWAATLEGANIHQGTLIECLIACAKCDDEGSAEEAKQIIDDSISKE